MVVKKQKPKSHGKPSVSKDRYKNSMNVLGINIDEYGPRRPRPIMVYKIYCHYRRTLDHSKYPWARQEKYADDAYDCRCTSDNICFQLEKKYPNWYFISVTEFVDPSTPVITGNKLPVNIIYDLNCQEKNIYNRLTSTNKSATDKLKQQVLKDAGIDENESQSEPSKKVKKTRKKK